MKFHSKPEAISYALVKLYKYNEKYKETKEISACIESLKMAFENHEQSLDVICKYLDTIKSVLDEDDFYDLIHLQRAIKTSSYTQTAEEKFANLLGRRAESQLFTLLLHSPTEAMMNSVNRVSIEILKAIDYLSKHKKDLINTFLRHLKDTTNFIGCGGFKELPTLEEIITLLQNNDRKKLTEIMFIHFKFGQAISRDIPITDAPVRAPVGRLTEYIKEIWQGNPEDFFKEAISKDSKESTHFRSYITDEKIYTSVLYKSEKGTKGRLGALQAYYTNRFGLMLLSQQEFSEDLPQHRSCWAPDCLGQAPDYDSQYVIDSIDNDTVYVSGPSGMTSVFLGQMEFMANFEDIKLKQHYLTAVASYIVGAGFHSLHEVLGPAEHSLSFVPGYNIAPPQKGKLAAPANYHVYFSQQAKIDPEFQQRRETAWNDYLAFFQHTYCPKKLPETKHEFNKKKVNKDQLYLSIINEIDRYINSRGSIDKNNKIKLNCSTRLFRNSQLTHEKIKNAIHLKSLVKNVFDSTQHEHRYETLLDLLRDARELDNTLEKELNKTYSRCKSGFARCLKNIDKLIHHRSADLAFLRDQVFAFK